MPQCKPRTVTGYMGSVHKEKLDVLDIISIRIRDSYLTFPVS
jgi:hypothetical protein